MKLPVYMDPPEGQAMFNKNYLLYSVTNQLHECEFYSDRTNS